MFPSPRRSGLLSSHSPSPPQEEMRRPRHTVMADPTQEFSDEEGISVVDFGSEARPDPSPARFLVPQDNAADGHAAMARSRQASRIANSEAVETTEAAEAAEAGWPRPTRAAAPASYIRQEIAEAETEQAAMMAGHHRDMRILLESAELAETVAAAAAELLRPDHAAARVPRTDQDNADTATRQALMAVYRQASRILSQANPEEAEAEEAVDAAQAARAAHAAHALHAAQAAQAAEVAHAAQAAQATQAAQAAHAAQAAEVAEVESPRSVRAAVQASRILQANADTVAAQEAMARSRRASRILNRASAEEAEAELPRSARAAARALTAAVTSADRRTIEHGAGRPNTRSEARRRVLEDGVGGRPAHSENPSSVEAVPVGPCPPAAVIADVVHAPAAAAAAAAALPYPREAPPPLPEAHATSPPPSNTASQPAAGRAAEMGAEVEVEARWPIVRPE